MSKFKLNDWDKSLISLGAERERKRIRRAQREHIESIRAYRLHGTAAALDAATRAPKKRGAR